MPDLRQAGAVQFMTFLSKKLRGKQKELVKLLNSKFCLTPEEEEKIFFVDDEAKLDAALEVLIDAKLKSEVLKVLES